MGRSSLTVLLLFAILSLQGQGYKWIHKIGGIGNDYSNGIAVDAGQNLVEIVNFSSNAILTTTSSFASRGQEDFLVVKRSSIGVSQWVKHIGSPGQTLAQSVAVDLQQNVYVTGTFSDSLYYGNQLIATTGSSLHSSFVIKLDVDGTFLWVSKIVSSISVNAKTITAGASGEVLISGNFEGVVKFGEGLSLLSSGGHDIFLLKLDDITGKPTLFRQIGGVDEDFTSQHVRDGQGNIFLTGDFRQTIDFDPSDGVKEATSNGLTDIFLLKLTVIGNYIWHKTYGGTGTDYGQSIYVDATNNILLTGRFSSTVNFGITGSNLISNGGTDIFLLKLDATGNTIWGNSYGSTENDQGNKVITNPNGIIYLAGIYRDIVDFNPDFQLNNSSLSNGGTDCFIAIYNQDGTYNQHFTLGGLANDQINDIVRLSNGEVVTSGGFGAVVDFDPTSSTLNTISVGALDAFLWNLSVCVNPYLKKISAVKTELCSGESVFIRIDEGFLNDAVQWSFQRNDCESITFASGNFLNIPVLENTTFYIKGWGNCVVNDPCQKIDIKVFKDSLRYVAHKLCTGDTLHIGNKKYTEPGVYIDSLVSISGCDSILVSEVTTFPKYFNIKSNTICEGDTVKVGNNLYTNAGTFTNVFTTHNGCDSTIITNVTVLPVSLTNVDTTICRGDSLKVGDLVYKTAGTFVQKVVAANGCNNIIVATIKVNETKFTNIREICFGDSISVGTKHYRAAGVYLDTLQSSNGCDSTLTTILNVLPISQSNRTISLCKGDSIRIGNSVYKTAGNYLDVLKNKFGCDSTIFSAITIRPKPEPVTFFKRICEGDSVRVGTHIYRASGQYRDTVPSANGCDSIVNTNLIVDIKSHFLVRNICAGDSVLVGTSVYKQSGIYTIPLKNILGCDSIVNLNLTSNPIKFSNITYRICPKDTVRVGIKKYISAGIYRDTLKTSAGCDSIIVSNISFNHVSRNFNLQICSGTSIFFNNKTYSQAGFFPDTLKKSDGCDSIINVSVNVNPVYNRDVIFEICKGQSVKVGNSTYFNPGKYIEQLQTKVGCDSIISFEIKVINFIPLINVTKDTLRTVSIQGATYQWYECRNGETIPFLGADKTEFPLFKSGKYALSITFKGCTYISDCIDFVLTDTKDIDGNLWKIYPNPVRDILTVISPYDGEAVIKDASGKTMLRQYLNIGINEIQSSILPDGIYIFEIIGDNKIHSQKIIKI
ncbi:MAG: T9SS type A sorting domain-containing protein [Saprospiraceae bacterium]